MAARIGTFSTLAVVMTMSNQRGDSVKNVQVIDGANNCYYPVYAFTDEEFRTLFPEPDQDIEFIEDAIDRVGDERLGSILENVWSRELKKSEIQGIHGTLFYELEKKKKYYPTKKESEMVTGLELPRA